MKPASLASRARLGAVLLWGLVSVLGVARADNPAAGKPAEAKTEKVQHFDIWEFRVEGNTLLSNIDVERAVYPYLGPQKSIAQVESARKELQQRYRAAGYPTVLVDIPEQQVQHGIVRLRVVEGRIERLRVTGSRYFSPVRIRKEVPALAPNTVPNLPRAQEQLAALNRESGDRSVIPVMRPGRSPGTVEVELKVKDRLPLHGGIEANNRYTEGTTHERLNASLRYDNLWQREHSLAMQYQTSPQNTNEVKALSATYLMHVPDSEKLLVLYGVRSESNVATLGDINVVGNGNIFGARLIFPFAARASYTHNLVFGVDRKNFKETVMLGADRLNTPIHYTGFSALYSGTRNSETDTTRFSVGPNFGVRGLGNDEQQFADKRFDARPNFLYLRGNVENAHKWFRGTTLYAKLDAQLSDSPLISNEQMSAGGADSVRGYPEAQQLGDYGVQGTIELRTPYLGPENAGSLQDLHALMFIDGAKLGIHEPLPNQQSSFILSSTGLGMRAMAWRRMNLDLDWARALKDSGSVKKGDTRLHFRLGYGF
ncbi:MAG: ShlB/FhaC/HecB family hemolysin secretion/activation protein [Dehalococcoidia bacterium]